MGAIRVGIVGTGFAAATHADALRRLPGVELVALAGRTEERAREEADRLGVPQAFGTYEQLLEVVDAVHDCTPNDLHAEVNLAVLQAGKHLLSEKPLALDSRESAAVVEAAAAAGVVAGVCFNYRHFPLVRQARETIAGGRVGAPHFVRGGYLQDWLLYEDDWNWRIDPARGGPSRAVADIGSHWADLVQHITGDTIQSVFADLGTLHRHRLQPASGSPTFGAASGDGVAVHVESEDFGSILVRFAGGVRGAFTVSQVSAGRKNHLFFEVDAARAALRWDQEEPNTLWVGRRDAPNSELPRDAALLEPSAAALVRFPAGHQEGWPDALHNLCADFYATVAAQNGGAPHEPSFATLADGHRLVQLVEAIVRSHREQQWVEVGSPREVAA
jgi:predicted dehydrogenase